MITERMKPDELRKELHGAVDYFYNMSNRWMSRKIERWMKKKEAYLKHQFVFRNQRYNLLLINAGNRRCSCSIYTYVNGEHGRLEYLIGVSSPKKQIVISNPHCLSRSRERMVGRLYEGTMEEIPYIREGREYKLLVDGNDIYITKNEAHDIKRLITCLTREHVTGKNMQELLAVVDKEIEQHDIYQWKN